LSTSLGPVYAMVCPDCLSGHIRTETPTGKVTKIHGLDTYVAEPPAGVKVKGLIIIISDLFGWEFVNSRLLADQYAASGNFIVYLPDFMSGPGVPVWMTVKRTRYLVGLRTSIY
jgi:dienelactone hydrolase